ncbi:periplasmic binding protein-like II [Coccomyxa subellipsoidea C-169]|uniref:Periplasmic binding protein-like II n=1 Tax=Coccomyxa subellipsoidea (strain C-169) TaxID=574566 RepID=I0YZV6_COCSC|nr:periplasmic binding protein-like II [Coccomyxa subellipsoidea C-169]EIE23925.1 periplasmic binding protein-like II [Coccomyxa subellipsoidea C-169]|eukprot:XP_005648469.1 periplasmic binding protein-like II [Coccomyxa subellipsoidea C-169]
MRLATQRLCCILGLLLLTEGHTRHLQQSKSVSNLPLVQGSGSTAASTLWRSIIANASATGNAPFSLTYDAVGSGQGQKSLFNRAYDYAVSDVPIPGDVYNGLDRPILQIPFAISALDAVHSVSGLSKPLNLNAFVFGAILQCTITRWDDPAIRAINPDAKLPSADIFPVVRVDSSGSTELVTNYLATDPSWALAVGKSLAWPKCAQQVQGSEGILNYIANQKNAVGYAEYGLARVNNIAYAALQNAAGNFVRPDQVLASNVTDIFGTDFIIPNSTVSAAWANVSLMSSRRPMAYPISGLEYYNIELDLSAKGYPQGLILKELAQYILSDAVQKPMKWFYFAPLPEKIKSIAKMDLDRIVLPKRPRTADDNNLPNKWINVYQPLSAQALNEPASSGGTFYNDERPLKPKDDMSPEFKKKLRDEYLSLGGSPNRAMGSNYFLWIIVIVSILAVLSWALGYI